MLRYLADEAIYHIGYVQFKILKSKSSKALTETIDQIERKVEDGKPYALKEACMVWSGEKVATTSKSYLSLSHWRRFDDFKGYMWQFTYKLIIGGKKFDGNILYE